MKKKLMALPVACVAVAMLGLSVMGAGSAAKAFKVEDKDGNDITKLYDGVEVACPYDITEDSWDFLDDDIEAQNSEAKREDAKLVASYEIDNITAVPDGNKTVTFLGLDANAGDVFVVLHEGGNFELVVGDAPVIVVSDCSPFYVFKISVQSSAQTGEYAAPYIAMISVALLACGAVFAVRAKKATK